jgi:hypothetical protein
MVVRDRSFEFKKIRNHSLNFLSFVSGNLKFFEHRKLHFLFSFKISFCHPLDSAARAGRTARPTLLHSWLLATALDIGHPLDVTSCKQPRC